jgi:GTP-binding protein
LFVDEVEIRVSAGSGGNGCLSFRREKFVPRGGPNGGNGGRGGSVYLVASPHLNTLINFRFHPEFRADRGVHGEGSNRTGADGKDLALDVPVGTVVYEQTTEGLAKLADLTEIGQRVLVAQGGRGGRGNAAFASSTNRAPRRTEPGEEGEDRQLRLRLKLVADVGLVGFPNAGKSTLISRISAARPKIADYPFTTLHPQLGVVRVDDREFVLADIPGLIEGAHEGAGLGDRFLGHVERCRVLLHLVDGTGEDAGEAYRTVRDELEAYGQELVGKPQIVALSKADALRPEQIKEQVSRLRRASKTTPLVLSAHSGEGVAEALRALLAVIDQAQQKDVRPRADAPAWQP